MWLLSRIIDVSVIKRPPFGGKPPEGGFSFLQIHFVVFYASLFSTHFRKLYKNPFRNFVKTAYFREISIDIEEKMSKNGLLTCLNFELSSLAGFFYPFPRKRFVETAEPDFFEENL